VYCLLIGNKLAYKTFIVADLTSAGAQADQQA